MTGRPHTIEQLECELARQSQQLDDARSTVCRLAAVLDASPVIAFLQDLDLRYSWVHIPRVEQSALPMYLEAPPFNGPDDAARLLELSRQVLETGQPVRQEVRLSLGGDLRWYDVHVQPQTSDARIIGVLTIATDITTLKQAAEAQRESEERLRLLGDNLPESAVYQYIHDANHHPRFLYFSAGIERLNGIRVEDVLQDVGTLHRQVLPEFLPILLEAESRCIRDLSDFDMDVPMRRPDGEVRWMRLHSRPRHLPSGQVVWDGVQTDVTDRKRAELALAASEARYRRLHESISDALVIVDMSGAIREYNRAFRDMLGYPDEELSTLSYQALTPERWHAYEDRVLREQILPRGVSEIYEKEYRRKDGTIFPIELRTYLVRDDSGAPSEMWAIIRDITDRKRSEQALRESELFLRETERIARVGGWKVNPRTDFLEWTEGVYEITEAPRDHQPGFTEGLEYYRPEYIPPLRESILRCLETGEPFTMECQLVTRSGKQIWTEVRGLSPVRDGEHSYVVGMFQDITPRKLSEDAYRQSMQTIHAAFHNAAIGFAIANPDGRFVEANPAYCEITGYDVATLRTLAYTQLVHPDDLASNLALNERMFKGEIADFVVENRYVRRDGRPVWVKKSVSLVRNPEGSPQHILALVEDVTDRKQFEEQRSRLLEAERVARQHAETALRLREGFLATISHELRNPLNAVMGWTRLLAKGSVPVEKATQIIGESASSLSQIVTDLLDMSRIISGKTQLQPGPTEITGLVQATLEGMRMAAQAKDITLDSFLAPDLREIICDPNRLKQILQNLLSNAIKFTPQGGRIIVVAEQLPTCLRIAVEDNGEGIDPAFLPYVFDQFRQADQSKSRFHGGLGLGLSVVKHLVELHGGTVRADSEGVGRGAKFTVLLPCPSAIMSPELMAAGAPGQDIPHPQDLDREAIRGRRVLIVDDDRNSCDFVARFLEDEAAITFTAYSGEEALRVFEQIQPDLVISDIGMPGMNGYQFVRQLRDKPHGRTLTCIALTAYARPEDREDALRAGFDEHVSKPFGPGQLARALANISRRGASFT